MTRAEFRSRLGNFAVFLGCLGFFLSWLRTALEGKSTNKREIGLNLNPSLNLMKPRGILMLLHAQTLHVMARAEIVWISPPSFLQQKQQKETWWVMVMSWMTTSFHHLRWDARRPRDTELIVATSSLAGDTSSTVGAPAQVRASHPKLPSISLSVGSFSPPGLGPFPLDGSQTHSAVGSNSSPASSPVCSCS